MNDILRSKDPNDLNDLPENVIRVETICQNHDKTYVWNIYVRNKRTNVHISNINKKNTGIV